MKRSTFQYSRFQPGRRRRGYGSLIGILIVLAIISLLMTQGYLKRNPTTGKTQAEVYIDRGEGAACSLTRTAIETDLTQMSMRNNGQVPNIHILRLKLRRRVCSGGGAFQIGDRGTVYCTLHNPAPEGVNVVSLVEETSAP